MKVFVYFLTLLYGAGLGMFLADVHVSIAWGPFCTAAFIYSTLQKDYKWSCFFGFFMFLFIVRYFLISGQ